MLIKLIFKSDTLNFRTLSSFDDWKDKLLSTKIKKYGLVGVDHSILQNIIGQINNPGNISPGLFCSLFQFQYFKLRSAVDLMFCL